MRRCSGSGFRSRYGELRFPVRLIAGSGDRVADADRHSGERHRDLPGTDLRVIPGLGHMVHYFAQDQIVQAVEALSRRPGIRP